MTPIPPRALPLREGRAPVRDRLITMLILAALLHGLIILGLTFNADSSPVAAPGLQVLLVSEDAPQAARNPNAAYLAQRTQRGSGDTSDAAAPGNRPTSPAPTAQAGAPGGTASAASDAPGGSDEQVLTTSGWSTHVRYLGDVGAGGSAQPEQPPESQDESARPLGPESDSTPGALRGPKRDELWVTPDTQAATLAPYLDAWRRKVERVGTIHYPNAARRGTAEASPVVEVGIAADGTLDRVVILRSSGNAALDDAALQILKLASPFDPFPPQLANEYRVLRFSYEWQFVGGHLHGGAVAPVP